MYNIEKKPVQAQIQAYGEFTKRGEREGNDDNQRQALPFKIPNEARSNPPT